VISRLAICHRQALKGWRYAPTAFGGLYQRNVTMVLDATGLAMHPFIAVLLATITGVGGGTIRDLFLARADVCVTAALAGSVVMVLCLKARLRPAVGAWVGGVACFLLRVVSMWEHWNLPKVGG
jgi:uncharacterized membrane protein YeiH